MILTATMLFACKDDDETVSGGSATLEISEADRSHSFDPNGGSKTVSVTASIMFTVEMEATDWLTVSEIDKTGFKINVDENANIESRNVKLILSLKGADNIEIDVSQPGVPTLTADRQSVEFNSGGGETLVSVNSTTYTATVSGGANWLTATTSGTNLRIQAETNPAQEERSAQITVHVDGFQDVVLTVIQEVYMSPTLSINPRTLEFTSRMSEKTVIVTTNRPVYSATVEDGVNWVTTEISGSNLIVKVTNNNYIDVRNATVTVHVEDANDVTLTVTQESSLVGMWTFEDVDNLGKATVGVDLEPGGDSYTSIDGPGNTKAVKPGSGSYYMIHHNIVADGGSNNVNEYTLMMDIRGSASEFSGWLSVLNTKIGNSGDGVLWIDGSGQIGYAVLGGYSSPVLTPDTWHRLIIAVKLDESSMKVYVDGNLAFTATDNIGVDGMMSLFPDVVYIGTDGSRYPGPNFAEVRIWSVQLSDDQIAELGNPR
jgi:hypothetical protein